MSVRRRFLRVISGDDNVHPAAIIFGSVFQIPVGPAAVFGFARRHARGGLLHKDDAIRSRQSSSLIDGDLKMSAVNILNGVVG